MLAKRLRLRKSADFQRVRTQGRSWSNRQLVLCIAENTLPESRFGFTISKRIGNAVVRNRLKRQMREAVRDIVDLVVPGYDIVVIARREIRGADMGVIEGALLHLMTKADLLGNVGDAPIE